MKNFTKKAEFEKAALDFVGIVKTVASPTEAPTVDLVATIWGKAIGFFSNGLGQLAENKSDVDQITRQIRAVYGRDTF